MLLDLSFSMNDHLHTGQAGPAWVSVVGDGGEGEILHYYSIIFICLPLPHSEVDRS